MKTERAVVREDRWKEEENDLKILRNLEHYNKILCAHVCHFPISGPNNF